MSEQPRRREIRSYVLREGRLTPGQQRAFDQLWPRFGVDWQPGEQLDLPALFGNDNPIWLEIGFGNGESLAEMAANHPERNYLGIEVHGPGVGHLLLKLDERGLENVRVLRHDAVEILRDALPDACLDGVQLFFADPWPKKKHHKRRIVQSAFMTTIARVLRAGGIFHAATDWEDYAEHMLVVFAGCEDQFENTAGRGNYSPRPADRPLTKFEQRGQRLGHGVWDLLLRRR